MAKRPAMVPQRIGAGGAYSTKFEFSAFETFSSFGDDIGQFQFISENLSEFLKRHIDFERVLAWAVTCFSLPRAFRVTLSYLITWRAVALSDTTVLPLAILEAWNVDLRYRDGHSVVPLASNQLALRDVAPKVLADASPYDISKASLVRVDSLHGG